jgi:hypothetical protein
MDADRKSRTRKKLLWPAAAVTIGALLSLNPFYAPNFSLQLGITAWFADMAIVLVLLAHSITMRLGILIAGASLAVPCFLQASPLSRGLLMCCMMFPFAVASAPLFAPPNAGFRGRLTYFFSWMGTQKIQRRACGFDKASLLHLVAATMVLAAALAGVKAASTVGLGLLLRWLAGGIMIFAFAEIATASHDFLTALAGLNSPALMRSPCLSTSVAEFWTKRWNVAASALGFRPLFFAPLARRGAIFGLFAAFLASAIGHVLLAYMAMMRWKISLVCGAFFLVQPFLILAERRMNVRRWPATAARVWSLAALAITSPLFVEPGIELIAPSLHATNGLLAPTLFTVGLAIVVNVFFLLGQLASRPGFAPPTPEPTPIAP